MLKAWAVAIFEVVVDSGRSATTTSLIWEAASVSDVIKFRLEQVITPRLALLRSSRQSRVYVDYYFYAYRQLAVWVLMPKWLLVSSTSASVQRKGVEVVVDLEAADVRERHAYVLRLAPGIAAHHV